MNYAIHQIMMAFEKLIILCLAIAAALWLLTGCTQPPVEVMGPPEYPSVQRGYLGCWYKYINGEWMPQGLPLCDVTLEMRKDKELDK